MVQAFAPQLSRSASSPSMAGSLMDDAIQEMVRQSAGQAGAEQQTVALQTELSSPSPSVRRSPSRLGPGRQRQQEQQQQVPSQQDHVADLVSLCYMSPSPLAGQL